MRLVHDAPKPRLGASHDPPASPVETGRQDPTAHLTNESPSTAAPRHITPGTRLARDAHEDIGAFPSRGNRTPDHRDPEHRRTRHTTPGAQLAHTRRPPARAAKTPPPT
ncbi:hypothetical protein JCM33774_21050 [Actinophytocola sp. KF-1]